VKAQYLLRFDDICPEMNWHVWDGIELLLRSHGIKPILAVIPDNQDPALRVSPSNPRFWSRVRQWQDLGWRIGMHGWQHSYVTTNAGLLGVNKYSEFAGLPRPLQQEKLRAGIGILNEEGIQPDLWVAPAHSFDAVTVELLRVNGFRYISDGFFPLPHIDEFGMTWIPQQLWSFRRRPFGVWTICFHVNAWTPTDLVAFSAALDRYRTSISDVATVLEQYGNRPKAKWDSVSARAYRSASAVQAQVKQLLGCN
jgi:peptidoglycan/xylan/chitin deacetylase (PgdA/CDA1 family)